MLTRKEIKELLPIMQAFAEGKTIQFQNTFGAWIDIPNNGKVFFDEGLTEFRIKPESKYRPFKNQEECWNEMLKHQPFGWVKDECKYVHIVCVYKNQIEFSPDEDADDILHSCTMTFSDVLEQGYTFSDGTPFGIKEE